jgi:hypothetical protein
VKRRRRPGGMRSVILLMTLLLGGVGHAATLDELAGAWGLTLPTGEAGWLGVSASDGRPRVRVMWAVGNVRDIDGATFTDDTLEFRLRGGQAGAQETVSVRVEGDMLRGTLRRRGTAVAPTTDAFGGKRLPPLPPAPDLAGVRYGEPIMLFNGRDLTGWRVSDPAKKNGWRVVDGVLVNITPKKDFSAYGDHANLRTHAEFEDFQLHLEFRLPPEGGNSGVYLRGMYEAQVTDRDSKMQGISGPGAIFGRIAPAKNAGKPAGEWESYDLTLVDRHITVVHNGETVIANRPVEGPTGGALLGDVTRPGPIYLQGDHTGVAFRNFVLRPVLKR